MLTTAEIRFVVAPNKLNKIQILFFKDHIHYVSKNNKIETVTTLEDIKIEAKPAFK